MNKATWDAADTPDKRTKKDRIVEDLEYATDKKDALERKRNESWGRYGRLSNEDRAEVTKLNARIQKLNDEYNALRAEEDAANA